MTKFNTSVLATAAAAALLLSGNALAASLQPATGEAPYFNQPAATSSTVQRADIEAAAAAHRPNAGMAPFFAHAGHASTLSRATVQREAAAALPATGEMSAQASSSSNVLPTALGE